jgi:hypothetical protein
MSRGAEQVEGNWEEKGGEGRKREDRTLEASLRARRVCPGARSKIAAFPFSARAAEERLRSRLRDNDSDNKDSSTVTSRNVRAEGALVLC